MSLQHQALNESPIGHNQSPKVTSEVVAIAEDINDMSFISAQSAEVTSHTTDKGHDGLLEEDENGAKDSIIKDGDVTDGLRNMSENLSTMVVNVSDNFILSLNCKISINLQAGRRLKMK